MYVQFIYSKLDPLLRLNEEVVRWQGPLRPCRVDTMISILPERKLMLRKVKEFAQVPTGRKQQLWLRIQASPGP